MRGDLGEGRRQGWREGEEAKEVEDELVRETVEREPRGC